MNFIYNIYYLKIREYFISLEEISNLKIGEFVV